MAAMSLRGPSEHPDVSIGETDYRKSTTRETRRSAANRVGPLIPHASGMVRIGTPTAFASPTSHRRAASAAVRKEPFSIGSCRSISKPSWNTRALAMRIYPERYRAVAFSEPDALASEINSHCRRDEPF
jgi:hypothetical protein